MTSYDQLSAVVVSSISIVYVSTLLTKDGISLAQQKHTDRTTEFRFFLGLLVGLCNLHASLAIVLSAFGIAPGSTRGKWDSTAEEAQKKVSGTPRSQCVAVSTMDLNAHLFCYFLISFASTHTNTKSRYRIAS